ncbi:Fic family protein [Acidiferrobacter thiooxydans]|uniref:Fic family protein n=1 Tax=Acidiferrobacter thiooxydans TaxID=163359 RepID=UPI001C40002C|nr:Fic family protein [Acidiferrobacter thiooxydans]
MLYLVIKDHPLSDGNKRIGAFLFILYLEQEGIAHTLNPAALTALALLIAESAPASKDLLIRLVMNLLGEHPV